MTPRNAASKVRKRQLERSRRRNPRFSLVPFTFQFQSLGPGIPSVFILRECGREGSQGGEHVRRALHLFVTPLPTACFVLQTNLHFLSSHSRTSVSGEVYVLRVSERCDLTDYSFTVYSPSGERGWRKLTQVGDAPLSSGGLLSGSALLSGGSPLGFMRPSGSCPLPQSPCPSVLPLSTLPFALRGFSPLQ